MNRDLKQQIHERFEFNLAEERLVKHVRSESGDSLRPNEINPEKSHFENEESFVDADAEKSAEGFQKKSMKEDFTKQALEYRKRFYDFHRAIEGYSSSVNHFAGELKKQLTMKISKVLDHQALADHFERQLYRLARNPKQTRKNWSEEETIFLISLVAYYSYYQDLDYNNLDDSAWKFIADIYPGKKMDQLRLRWLNVFKVTLSKAPWTQKEDDTLMQLVKERGAQHWKEMAIELAARSGVGIFRQGKQCRERWINHLDPSIKKGAWTEEEDTIILQNFIEVGKKWAEIAKRLGGRTENSVKNRWISLMKKYKTELNYENAMSPEDIEGDELSEKKMVQAILNAKNGDKSVNKQQLAILFSEKEGNSNLQSNKHKQSEELFQSEESEQSKATSKLRKNKTKNTSSLPNEKRKAKPSGDSSKDLQPSQMNNGMELYKNLAESEYTIQKKVTADSKMTNLPQNQQQVLATQLAKRQQPPPQNQQLRNIAERHVSHLQATPEQGYYREEQLHELNRYLGYDPKQFAPEALRMPPGVILPELIDPRIRTFEHYQPVNTATRVLQHPNAIRHMDLQESWFPAGANAERFNHYPEHDYAHQHHHNTYASNDSYQEPNEEDSDPHHYLLVEKALGTGKQLEKVIEQQPNALYFAVVNTLSREIFFVDSATKRNYGKTLKVIREEGESMPQEPTSFQSRYK